MTGAERITSAIRASNAAGRPAVAGFITGGYPDLQAFPALLDEVARSCDVVEVGVPFSDPMADGVTIQRASEVALTHGTTVGWLLDAVTSVAATTAVIFMSYFNPVLQYGVERFAAECAERGISGLIVPDLPFEECLSLRCALDAKGVALVQLVTPATPDPRLQMLCRESRGFVYAVTTMGTTGASVDSGLEVTTYLDRVRDRSALPVLAGFGIRSAGDVARLAPHADGVIVGSAVVEAIDNQEDPGAFLRGLVGG
ncbi:MAG: tryptophan synthase subunit alpha [Longimicrobiales bacterium]